MNLNTALSLVYDQLNAIALSPDYWTIFNAVFGTNYNTILAATLQQQWQAKDFSGLPPIEILSSEVLGSASGAYAASTNTIYLSEDLLAAATSEQVVAVLLEEIGHYVDAQVNTTDTFGDEGAYFAAMALGRALSAEEILRLQTENDLGFISLGGMTVEIEQYTNDTSYYVPSNGSLTIDTSTDPIFYNGYNSGNTGYLYNGYSGTGNLYNGSSGTGNLYNGSSGTGNLYNGYNGTGNLYNGYNSIGNLYNGSSGTGNLYNGYNGTGNLYNNNGSLYNGYNGGSTGNLYNGYNSGSTGYLYNDYNDTGTGYLYNGYNGGSTGNLYNGYNGIGYLYNGYNSKTLLYNGYNSGSTGNLYNGYNSGSIGTLYNGYNNVGFTGILDNGYSGTGNLYNGYNSGSTGTLYNGFNSTGDLYNGHNIGSTGTLYNGYNGTGNLYNGYNSGKTGTLYNGFSGTGTLYNGYNGTGTLYNGYNSGKTGTLYNGFSGTGTLYNGYNSTGNLYNGYNGTGNLYNGYNGTGTGNLYNGYNGTGNLYNGTASGSAGNLYNGFNGTGNFYNGYNSGKTGNLYNGFNSGGSTSYLYNGYNSGSTGNLYNGYNGTGNLYNGNSVTGPLYNGYNSGSTGNLYNGYNSGSIGKLYNGFSSSGKTGTLYNGFNGTGNLYNGYNGTGNLYNGFNSGDKGILYNGYNGTGTLYNGFNSGGTGTLYNGYNGTGTLYNGLKGTIINAAGSLIENRSGSLILNSGLIQNLGTLTNLGTLAGTGTFNGTLSVSSGSIAPGGTFTTSYSDNNGIFTVQGNLTQSGSATLNLSLTNTSSFDVLKVTGDANLSGGSITLSGFSAFSTTSFNSGTSNLILIDGDSDNDNIGTLQVDPGILSSLNSFVNGFDTSLLDFSVGLNNNDLVLKVVSNQAPVITSVNTANFVENGTGTAYQVTATDPDNNPITYGLATTGDYALFNINSSTGVVTFKTAPNYESPTDAGANNVYDITVTASDGSLSVTKAVAITVTNVNEAPTNLTLSANAIAENTVIGTGIKIGDITITDSDATGNNNVLTVEGSDAANFEIRNGTELYFKGTSPDFETKPSYSISLKSTDGALTYSKAFTVNVSNVNESPTNLTLSTNTITENTVIGTGIKIGDITITDPDATGNNNVLTVEGTDAANFEIRNGTELYFKGTSPDFESKPSYSINLKSTDGALTYSKAFTVNVSNVNEAPTDLTLSANTITENTVIGTGIKIGDITITDPDVTGNNNVLTVEGSDAANFEIRNGTELYFNGTSPDFENKPSYSINLKSTDGALTYSKAFTVNVSNVNEAPTNLTLSANTITENTVIDTGVKIGDITITDPDATGNNNVLTVEGTDAANFEIRNGTELYFKDTSPDFETKPSYSISLKSTDGALTYSKAFTVNVSNVNEAPSITSGAIVNFAENSTGTAYQVTATDPDAGTTLSYSLTGSVDDALFDINSSTGVVTFKTAPDYENPKDNGKNNVYDITVTASDGTLSDSKAVVITVTDVNENQAPTAVSLQNQVTSLAENTSTIPRIKVADITVTDDGLGANSLSVSGTDAASFEVDTTGLYLKAGTILDFENKANYQVTVNVDDATVGNTPDATTAFSLALTNLDEVAPTITSGNTATGINENSGANQLVYTVTSTDIADIFTGSTTYSLKNVADFAAFTIDANSGQVKLIGNPDYESKPSYSFTVIATDAASNQSEQLVSLGINNLDDTAPTITSGNTATVINENSGANQLVYTVTSTDTGDIFTGSTTYSLKNIGDFAAFTIDANSGQIKLIGNPDYETKPSYSFTVIATDAANNASEKLITLSVIDRAVFSINDVSFTEGATAQNFTVTAIDPISNGSSTATVNYATVNGTAFAGYDYTAKSGVLTFSTGINTQTISVPITDDSLYEPTNETLTVNLSNASSNATISRGVGSGTITDNDLAIGLGVRDSQVLEGNSGNTSLIFQLDLSGVSGQTVTVNYSVSDGTATTANNDYVAASGTVSFNPGLTSNTLAITVIGDTVNESNENLVLTLSNAVGAVITKNTAMGTIVDDDSVSSIVYTGTSGNDTLRGNSAAPPTPVLDELFQGLGGNDSLFGYYGKNIFDGGAGADSLYGLADQDTFLFPLLSDSTLGLMDTITRFSSTEGDRLKVGATPALPLNLFSVGTLTATSLTNAASLAYSAADGNTGLAVDEAVLFKYGSNYYLSVNNSANAAFISTDDLLLKFGTLVGTPAIGTLTVSDYFAV